MQRIASPRSSFHLAEPMPDSIANAAFIFSAILILIALLGGKFKIFGSEISDTVSNPLLRFVAFAIGSFLLVLVLDIQAPFGNILGGKASSPPVAQPDSDSPSFTIPFVEPVEEISWSDTARQFSANVDQDFRLRCPEGGTIGNIYGTDIYTSGSSICSAAVHAGIINAKDGGIVKIRSLGSQDFFNGTARNGVTSGRYGSDGGSFTFIDSRRPIATEQIQILEWSDTASNIRGRLDQDFEYRCPENGDIARVYGTDIYTSSSSICSAAVHSGVISARDGGNVKIQVLGPQAFFNGTDRNGVVSQKYREYGSSFVFIE